MKKYINRILIFLLVLLAPFYIWSLINFPKHYINKEPFIVEEDLKVYDTVHIKGSQLFTQAQIDNPDKNTYIPFDEVQKTLIDRAKRQGKAGIILSVNNQQTYVGFYDHSMIDCSGNNTILIGKTPGKGIMTNDSYRPPIGRDWSVKDTVFIHNRRGCVMTWGDDIIGYDLIRIRKKYVVKGDTIVELGHEHNIYYNDTLYYSGYTYDIYKRYSTGSGYYRIKP